MSFWTVLIFAGLSAASLLAIRSTVHWFQLESYQFPGFFRTMGRNTIKAVLPGIILNIIWLGGAWLLDAIFHGKQSVLSSLIMVLLLLSCGFLLRQVLREKKEKKPLAYTARIKRLYTVAFFFFMLVLMLSAGFGIRTEPGAQHADRNILFLICMFFPLFLPLWFSLAGLLAWPIEKLISEMYFRDAQHILKKRPDLILIGITGSWGKTSVKYILGTLLQEHYNTLITPASYNTPMGVTKIIRTKLEAGHKVFIAEMGARHVGDIREMCRLVHPSIGILTSVGPQHLDTFRTIERVTKTKYELIDAIPENGVCFFADDGGIVRSLYEKTKKEKYISGTDAVFDGIWAENIRSTPDGSKFDVCTKDRRICCETEMLGELNIRNIVLCVSVCIRLGLTDKEIERGVSKLKAVEHRLQLIRNSNGITVIDDAFNSNILGAEQAFRVIGGFPSNRFIVTPGMVELGDREEEMNRHFGEMMADACDTAILIGKKRSRAIREGLMSKSFPEASVFVVNSLDEAAQLLGRNACPGDTILFENDLPDNYSE